MSSSCCSTTAKRKRRSKQRRRRRRGNEPGDCRYFLPPQRLRVGHESVGCWPAALIWYLHGFTVCPDGFAGKQGSFHSFSSPRARQVGPKSPFLSTSVEGLALRRDGGGFAPAYSNLGPCDAAARGGSGAIVGPPAPRTDLGPQSRAAFQPPRPLSPMPRMVTRGMVRTPARPPAACPTFRRTRRISSWMWLTRRRR